MTISKAELISQILTKSCLNGDALEKFKLELQSKTLDELSSMLSNSAPVSVNFKNFVELPQKENKFSDNIWISSNNKAFYDDFLNIEKSEPAMHLQKKKLSPAQEKDAREFAQNYLSDTVQQASNIERKYVADYGIIDGMWDGIKDTVNLFDMSKDGKAVTTFDEMYTSLSEEYRGAQKIKNAKQKGAFEYQFEKSRGIEFDAVKVLDFKEKSETYLELSIYKDKAESLNKGVNELKKILKKEQALDMLKKQGQNIPESAYPKESFEAKFAKIINEYCNGDEKLKQQLITQIAPDAKSISDLPPKEDILKSISTLSARTNESYHKQLGQKNFEQYEKEYQNAYKSAFGGDNSKESIQTWVENQKMGAGGVKMAGIVVSTILLGGSNLVASGAAKIGQAAGTRAAAHITRLGMTSFGVGEGVAIDYANALTSQTGLTKEKNQFILGSAKENLPYAFFGAYVSGPMGSKIVNALKGTNAAPKILEKAFTAGSKAAGFTTEVSVDTLFELAISDRDFMSVLQNNSTGESQARLFNKFGTMLIGGRANTSAKAALRNAGLENSKVRKTIGGKYELITPDGKNYIADSPDLLISGLLAKVSSTSNSQAQNDNKSIVNSFGRKKILENDIVNHINQPDAGIPLNKSSKTEQNEIHLKESQAPAPDEFKSILKAMNFTDDEIKLVDLNDKKAGATALAFKLLSETKMPDDWDFSDSEFKTELISAMNNHDSPSAKSFRYMNKENITVLDKYVKFPDDAAYEKAKLIYELFDYSSNPELVFEKLPILSKMVPEGKLDSAKIIEIALMDAESLAKLTNESVHLAQKINSQVPEQYRLILCELSGIENTSPEQITRYINEANRISKFPVDFSLNADDLTTLSTRMSSVSDMLEKFPMDLSTASGEKVWTYYLEQLAKEKDLTDIQKFVNTLSPVVKERGISYLANSDSSIKAPEIAEIFNITAAPDYGKCDINMRAIENMGITDYAGLRDLIKAMKGTNLLEYSHKTEDYLHVKNGDYKGAAQLFEKLMQSKNENKINLAYVFNSVCNSEDFSYKNALKTLEFMENNNIKLNQNLYSILNDKNAITHLKMVDYMKSKGFDTDADSTLYSSLDTWNTKNYDEFKSKIDMLLVGNGAREAYLSAKVASNALTVDEFKAVLNKYPLSEPQNNIILSVLSACTNENKPLAMKLLFGQDFNSTPEMVYNILLNSNKDTVDFANKLCFTNEYDVPKSQIARILASTKSDNIELAKKLCSKDDFSKYLVPQVLSSSNKDNTPFIEQVIAMEGLNKNRLPDMLNALLLHDGINSGKVDTNKVKRYTNLLQNPKTSPFVVKMLNDGMDINTVAFLSKTRQKLDAEKTTSSAKSVQKSLSDNMSADQKDVFNLFEVNGFSEKESASVLKAISSDGVVNVGLQSKALEIAKLGVSKNKIGEIINSAKISGEYNPKIVDDFTALQNMGLNPLLEKNLAVLNNISGADAAVKFNSKVKKQIKGMVQGLSPETKNDMQAKGIDIDSIIAKLDAKIVKEADGVPPKSKVISGLRSKQNIKGFERIVIDKYNPDEKVWRNEAATKDWAQNQYDSIKNGDYKSRTYSNANEHRDKMLKEWFDFMDNEPDLKENVYAKIIVADFVTKDLLPENADIPPQLDKTLVKEILGSALNNNNISFSSLYSQKIREKAMKGSNVEEVNVDGIKGKWYTVPQTDSSSPDYKTNVDKVKAFSDGTNWCIRTFNAEPYVKQGAMHFFVDENGLTQVCVRETAPGSVYEIQKRQQNSTVPIPYINVINDYMTRNGLNAQENCQKGINKALNSKPVYDGLRKEFKDYSDKKDYNAIFEQMGITTIKHNDGTISLSHYNPIVKDFTLSELGIKENDLLMNVSEIFGDASFKNSNATVLPNLEYVRGKFIFDESNLSDVRKLKEINGYKINWE